MLIAGCSQNSQDVSDTFQSAFFSSNDQTISTEQINNQPYASLVVQMDDQPQALLILLWVEPSQYTDIPSLKWISANKELLVTRAGRLVKSIDLPAGNLSGVYSLAPDPLSLNLLKPSTPKTWHYTLRWQPGNHFNYPATSTFYLGGLEERLLATGKRELLYVTEQVDIDLLDQHYRNEYWLDPQNGQVISSVQHLYPGSAKIALSQGKPFAGE